MTFTVPIWVLVVSGVLMLPVLFFLGALAWLGLRFVGALKAWGPKK